MFIERYSLNTSRRCFLSILWSEKKTSSRLHQDIFTDTKVCWVGCSVLPSLSLWITVKWKKGTLINKSCFFFPYCVLSHLQVSVGVLCNPLIPLPQYPIILNYHCLSYHLKETLVMANLLFSLSVHFVFLAQCLFHFLSCPLKSDLAFLLFSVFEVTQKTFAIVLSYVTFFLIYP